MSIVIDGVTLPEFPAELEADLQTNPYMVVFRIDGYVDEVGYYLYLSPQPFSFAQREVTEMPLDCIATLARLQGWECIGTTYTKGTASLASGFINVLTDNISTINLVIHEDVVKNELVWSNHDVKTVIDVDTTNMQFIFGDEIYFPNSEAPKSGIVIDGIELPAFPEGFLDETNKYYTVFDMKYGDMEGVPDDVTIPPMYMAIASSSPAFYVPKELNSLNANAFGMIAFVCDVVTKMTAYEIGVGDTWENPIPYLKEMGFAVENIEAAGFLATPKWANYDIKTATQFTKTDEPYIIGSEIYFPNSEKPKGIVIDGIELPPFPETGYKYEAVVKAIQYWGSTPTPVSFWYVVSNTEMIRIPQSLLYEEGTMPEDLSILCAPDFSGLSFIYAPEGEDQDWSGSSNNGFTQILGTYDMSDSGLDITQISNLEWSNHNIKNATAINPDTQEITVGDEIYWYAGYASDQPAKPSLPPYLCESSDWYKAVCNEIRRISKNHSSFEFDKDSIEKALYGGVVSPKSIIEGSYTKIIVPETVNVNNPNVFFGNTVLQFADLGKASQIHVQTLQGKGNQGVLDTLIMRSETVVTVNGISGTSYDMYPLYGTDVDDGTGYIYVPAALVDSYKNDSVNHWSEYANQFRAIEDYPDICGLS